MYEWTLSFHHEWGWNGTIFANFPTEIQFLQNLTTIALFLSSRLCIINLAVCLIRHRLIEPNITLPFIIFLPQILHPPSMLHFYQNNPEFITILFVSSKGQIISHNPNGQECSVKMVCKSLHKLVHILPLYWWKM